MPRFAVTVILSAFLLFLVQPLMGKVVLPWFGGAPAVWTTCLLFFQVVLLGGYAWSHLVVRRLQGAWQRRAHLILLGVAVLTVIGTAIAWGTPLVPTTSLRPESTESPTWHLLAILGLSVGVPYFALSSTGPLLQAWVAQRVPTVTAMRLYSASNIGSLVGLLAFPIALEPWWPLRTLAWAWTAGFVIFAIACASLAWNAPIIAREPAAESKLEVPRVALWILLAALPSGLLLAITNHLTQDVAPIPFLWVLPLVLYLASFVVTFDSDRWYRRAWALPLLGASALFCVWLLLSTVDRSALTSLLGDICFLTMACFVAHGELVRLRPAGEHITAFYLAVSAGGALGGVLVGLIAPRVLSDLYELPLLAGALVLTVGLVVVRSNESPRLAKVTVAVATLLAVLFAWSLTSPGVDVVETRRDFFGVLRIERDPRGMVLTHGRIQHGTQLADPAKRRLATTYYSPSSGIGRWLKARQEPVHVGGVGLGVGTLAAYARPGDTYRFYEISRTVMDIAEGPHFSYLRDAPTKPELVLGDARASLEREPPNAFDVLVVDAFSGDAVPTHLLTKEAIAIYLSHLRGPSSVLALHVSNRYIRLLPVVARHAREFKLKSIVIDGERGDDWAHSSLWVLLSAEPIEVDVTGAENFDLTKFSGPLWTDEFTSLWGLVAWGL